MAVRSVRRPGSKFPVERAKPLYRLGRRVLILQRHYSLLHGALLHVQRGCNILFLQGNFYWIESALPGFAR